jgi:hypothetical protein
MNTLSVNPRTSRGAVAWLVASAISLGCTCSAVAQPVLVSLKLDQNQIGVGGTTTLRVFAVVAPAVQPQADRIFSWYIDILNLNGAIAALDYAELQRPTADKNPQTSSAGLSEGANRLGIYDTFINLPAAGHDAPVELLTVPLKGLAPGMATLRVRAGSRVSELSADFLVALKGDGEPLAGGNYDAATVAVEISNGAVVCTSSMVIARSAAGLGPSGVTLTFAPCVGKNHVVEFTDALRTSWEPLTGAPHNSGAVNDGLSALTRFYRLRISE